MFSPLTAIAILIAILVVGWVIWFLIGFVRYIRSGDYDVDKRLQNIGR